jgi:selenocysteine lyase/cysteine desulfurase
MEMMASWGAAAVAQRLSALTRRIADGLAGANAVQALDERFRAPHVLSLGFPGGMPDTLIPALASQQIYVAARLGRMRVSPHVYNDEADADRFVAAMRQATDEGV